MGMLTTRTTLQNGVVTASQLNGDASPAVGAGVVAEIGSIYQQSNGVIWVKSGVPDTGWSQIGGPPSSPAVTDLYATNRIGIQNNSPTVPLQIGTLDATSTALNMIMSGRMRTNGIYLGTGTGLSLVVDSATNPPDFCGFYANYNFRLVVSKFGRVGVNVRAPVTQLHVVGDGADGVTPVEAMRVQGHPGAATSPGFAVSMTGYVEIGSVPVLGGALDYAVIDAGALSYIVGLRLYGSRVGNKTFILGGYPDTAHGVGPYVAQTDGYYWGIPTASGWPDGTWRLILDAGDMKFQLKSAGVWVDKDVIAA